jgi:hypothetical protein
VCVSWHPTHTTRTRTHRQATATPTTSHAELLSETQKLVALAKRENATQEQLDAQAAHITQLSASAGTDKIDASQNNGTFRGYTLTVRRRGEAWCVVCGGCVCGLSRGTLPVNALPAHPPRADPRGARPRTQGRTAQRFRTVITLGVLSFNNYQPLDQKVCVRVCVCVVVVIWGGGAGGNERAVRVCQRVCASNAAGSAGTSAPVLRACDCAPGSPYTTRSPNHHVASQIRMGGSDEGSVLKGQFGDHPQAYVVTAPFELVSADKVGDDASWAEPLGIKGLHVVVGEYKQAADNPQRLAIFFRSECGGAWLRRRDCGRDMPVHDCPRGLHGH